MVLGEADQMTTPRTRNRSLTKPKTAASLCRW